MRNTIETAAERRNREQLEALSGLLKASVAANAHNEPRYVSLPVPRSWKGWTALSVLAMAALGAVTHDPAPAPETRIVQTTNASPVAGAPTRTATATATTTATATRTRVIRITSAPRAPKTTHAPVLRTVTRPATPSAPRNRVTITATIAR